MIVSMIVSMFVIVVVIVIVSMIVVVMLFTHGEHYRGSLDATGPSHLGCPCKG
jgi:hypothetical protein